MSLENLTLDDIIRKVSGEDVSMAKEASDASVETTPVVATSEGASLEELLAKSASANTELSTDEELNDMNKQAQEQGKALADLLIGNLVKQANEVVAASDQMVAEQMSQQAATAREGVTVTDTLKDLIIRGVQNGAATEELSENVGQDLAAVSDAAAQAAKTPTTPAAAPNGTALGSVGEAANPEVEKAAAVSHLVGEGMDFDEAVARVKQAEEAIAAETIEMAKIAAANELITAGFSMSEAVALVEGSAADLGL